MWETVKLGDVCDFQNGFAFKSALFKENGKPILRISNIQNEKIDTRKTVYFDAKDYDTDFTRYEVKPDDLLIAMSGATTGKIGFNKTDTTYYLNQRVGNLKPKPTLDKVFLYYLLSTKVQENLSISKGAAQPNLSSEQIKNISFSLPPLAEQQRIVAKLDAAFAEIDGAVAASEEAAINLRSLRSILYEQIIIQNCSSYTEYTLKEIVAENCSLSYGIVQPGEDVPSGLPIVRPVDMHKKFINIKLLKRINPLIADGYKRTTLEGNELLMSVRGSTGIISVTSDALEGANVTRGIIPIRFNSQLVERDFGYYAMLSHKVQKQISDATYGAALQQINVKDVKQIKVAIPAISEQKNIIDILNKIDKSLLLLERCSSQKMANITSLKSAILAQELQSEAA
jgi:type I restriction enzyme S subunit